MATNNEAEATKNENQSLQEEDEYIELEKPTSTTKDTYDSEQISKITLSVCPNISELPECPRSAVDSNYVHYFAIDFLKPGHDQYIYRHANGLCVIGLAPTHVVFKEHEKITAVDFNVGKGNRSEVKVTGKRKKNAHFLESNSALCKIIANDTHYIARCCVKGSLLEVNDCLIKNPDLLNISASREGYIAIMMPRSDDWAKAQNYLLNEEEYKKIRGLA